MVNENENNASGPETAGSDLFRLGLEDIRVAISQNPKLSAAISIMLEDLHPRETAVLRGLFWLDGERSISEIANEQEVTVERIRQIQSKALAKLQFPDRSQALARLLDGEDE